MNPNDMFWLASYAHRVITPKAESLDGYLIIHMHFTGPNTGIDLWVHHNDASKPGMLGHRIIVKTKQQVDAFVASLWPVPAFV